MPTQDLNRLTGGVPTRTSTTNRNTSPNSAAGSRGSSSGPLGRNASYGRGGGGLQDDESVDTYLERRNIGEASESGRYWGHGGAIDDIGEAMFGEHRFRAEAPRYEQDERGLHPGAVPYRGQKADEERAMGLDARGAQGDFAGYLQGAVRGEGPSVAAIQQQQGLEDSIRQAASQAASARGVNAAQAAMLQATGEQAAMSGARRDAAMLRAQEQIAREGLYSDFLGGMRQQDIAGRGLSIDEAMGIADLENAAMERIMAEQQLNTQIAEGMSGRRQQGASSAFSAGGAALGAIGMMSDIRAKEEVSSFGADLANAVQPIDPWADTETERRAREFEQQRAQQRGQLDSVQAARAAQAQGAAQQQAAPAQGGDDDGGILGTIGGVMGMLSDEDSKEGVAAATKASLDPIEPVTFRYKEEAAKSMGTDTEPRVGFIAQDLEKSPAFAGSVFETPMGKAVDGTKLLQADTAMLAGLNERINDLERKVKGAK